MIARHAGASGLALLVATAQFALIQQLVGTGEAAIDELGRREPIRLQLDERETEVRRKQRRPQPPTPPPTPPRAQSAQQQRTVGALGGIGGLSLDLDVSADLSLDGLGAAQLDRGAYPKFRIQQRWPSRAEDRQMPGCVLYTFTITKTGAVRDVRIVESSSSMFERHGVRAVEQWRYEPLLVGGEAQESTGQSVRLVWGVEGKGFPDHPACRGVEVAEKRGAGS